MDIKCRKTSCKYNDSYTCIAKSVNIAGDTGCASFSVNKENDSQDFTKNMFEADLEYSNSRHIKDVCLNCEAKKCLFNKNKNCNANGITILDEGKHKPTCATFIKDFEM